MSVRDYELELTVVSLTGKHCKIALGMESLKLLQTAEQCAAVWEDGRANFVK